VLASLTLHAANAINNARRYSEESARRAYLSALLEINTKIGSMAPTETLLASIADEAARLLDVGNAGFRLLDGEDLVLAGLAGTASQTMVRPRIRVGESLSGKVVATGRTLICEIQSVPDVVPDHLDADRRLGYTMFLGGPLRVGDRTLGVLAFRARRAFPARGRWHEPRHAGGRPPAAPGRQRVRACRRRGADGGVCRHPQRPRPRPDGRSAGRDPRRGRWLPRRGPAPGEGSPHRHAGARRPRRPRLHGGGGRAAPGVRRPGG